MRDDEDGGGKEGMRDDGGGKECSVLRDDRGGKEGMRDDRGKEGVQCLERMRMEEARNAQG